MLSSCLSDNVVCLWRLEEGGGAENNVSMDTTANKENWTVIKALRYVYTCTCSKMPNVCSIINDINCRGHLEDIYDMCWSANSCCLVTGSVDNTAIIWDINKGIYT